MAPEHVIWVPPEFNLQQPSVPVVKQWKMTICQKNSRTSGAIYTRKTGVQVLPAKSEKETTKKNSCEQTEFWIKQAD